MFLYSSHANSLRIEQLQNAALNYDSSARSYRSVAENLITAKKLQIDGNNELLQSSIRMNAYLKLQSADNLILSSQNFDNAVRIWEYIATLTPEDEKKRIFTMWAETALEKSTSIIKMAVELMEDSAIDYMSIGDNHNSAIISNRAGKLRETLAERIK